MRQAKKQYVFRSVPDNGVVAFVPHPSVEGAWIRTDASVVFAACSHCGAQPGMVCMGRTGRPMASTHCARRNEKRGTGPGAATYKLLRNGAPIAVVVTSDAVKMQVNVPSLLDGIPEL